MTRIPRGTRVSPSLGQSTVEFALVLLPLMLVVVGVFDLGRAVFASHLLASAARDGAREGIVGTRTADAVCARARAAVLLPDVPAAAGCGVAGPLTVAVPQRGTAGSPADPVRVTLSYVFRPATPLVAQVVGAEIVLRASSSMVVEH